MNLALARHPSPALLDCATIGAAAIAALRIEIDLYPKPGLVSPVDNGSHADMTHATFLASLRGLTSYFPAIAAAGAENAPFEHLRRLGMDAERRMLAATCGVNTHRGAIFCLGLLAATAGALTAAGMKLTPRALRRALVDLWGAGIEALPVANSHGGNAARRYGVRSARAEALAGYPAVFETGLPVLQHALAETGCPERASLQAFMAIMAELDDTNLLHRAGRQGLAFARAEARRFLDLGGARRSGHRTELIALHHKFVARRLSPGGSADMLAACWFVHFLGLGDIP